VDYAQALPWIEMAAAQDVRAAVGRLRVMYVHGKGVTPSWRRA
jgi:TPR repeat protein